MKKKIVIAGGTGFIGSYLNTQFSKAGYQVLVISRDAAHISWNDSEKIKSALEGALLLINLAGKSVDCRYTDENKVLIVSSRINTTQQLQDAVTTCNQAPKLWINSSTATIYRHAEDRAMDEESGDIGKGFSVDVAKAWESAFFSEKNDKVRKVALRIAIVLGPDGGVMKPYTNMVRFGLGGRQGKGTQIFSWIHVEDLYRIITFIMDDETLQGVYNASAPYPISNTKLMQTFRQLLKPFIALPSPTWLLKIGAIMIGTETELVLKSRWVIPKRLEDAGFAFKFKRIDEALTDILKKK